MKLALFDLDHTLLPIDSDYAWGEFTIRIGWCDAEHFARQNDAFYADYQAGSLDIHEYVRFATDAFRRQGPQAAAQAHAQFMQEVVQQIKQIDLHDYNVAISQVNALILQAQTRLAEYEAELDDEESILMLL